ncbi:hypothetical protein KDAU_58470 [Dictyobacter aurantiacus]|uniref:DUF11 domain-containing protein n=2 Tax=Dictyobacter aurantiacus TaxID=1936993 RepID=A0A401ZNN4_9CHLR|nr:hypothetical protein KDAU_58470 [Dictyobacter aurantiacus]
MGVPTATATATRTPSGPTPNLYIRQLRMGSAHLDVGKKLTYVLFSGNNEGAASVKKHDSIVIMDVVPLGLKDLKVQAKHWKITLSDTVSPAVLTATYDGSYPVKAGAVLSPIFLTGIVTEDAAPSITTTATVDAPNNTNPLDSMVSDTVYVGSDASSPYAPVSDTLAGTPALATPSAVPSATAMATAFPSAAAMATALPSVVPSATALPTLTATVAPSPSPTPSATVMATVAPSPSPTPSATVRATVTPTPVVTATANPALTATAMPSPTPTATSTVMAGPTPRVSSTPITAPLAAGTATSTTIATPSMGPRLSISISRAGAPTGDTYAAGQQVSYVLQVTNAQANENQIVSVFDIAAVGISNVTFTAPGWTLGASNTVGPVALSGTFNGPYPIAAGASLPPITISGTLTSTAGPLFSNAAAVTSSDNPDSTSNMCVDSISVQAAAAPTMTATAPSMGTTTPTAVSGTTPTAVSGTTPTAVSGTTPTAVGVATPTAGRSVPPTFVTEPTATATAPATGSTATVMPATTPAATSSAVTAPGTSNQGLAARPFLTRRSGLALAIVNSNLYGSHGSVQGRVKLALVVANTSSARAVAAPGTITVDEVIPLGLSQIEAQGKDWRISLSDTVSPAIVHAQYIGKTTLGPDMALPPISITGVLNRDAVPILTSTAAVSLAGTSDGDNAITASDTLLVRDSWQQLR